MHCIFFNGPPGSGKDTACDAVDELTTPIDDDDDDEVSIETLTTLLNREHLSLKFAEPLREAAHALFGYPERGHDYYEETKNFPALDFFGLTPRSVYIALSERFVKPAFGEEFFGKIAARTLKQTNLYGAPNTLVTFSDCGFLPEIVTVIRNAAPSDRFLLARIHRNGQTFVNDSRSYLSDFGLTFDGSMAAVDIYNNGTIEEFHEQVKEVVSEWVIKTSSN